MMDAPERFETFRIRDALPQDKGPVLAFTAQTWEFGDYIEYVYDDWLHDRTGRFIVAEDTTTGAIAAIDKLTMLSPAEAWFEGLRVNPDYRGRGLAPWLQHYMIGQARRLGARTIRFLTFIENLPVHHMAYRDGFSMIGIVRFWKRVLAAAQNEQDAGADRQQADAIATVPIRLRQASPGEGQVLFDWWLRSSAYATQGLVNRDWSFSATTGREWADRAGQGHLLVAEDADLAQQTLPPPTVLVSPREAEGSGPATWVICAVTALGRNRAPLMLGLIEEARRQGIGEINGLLPDTAEVEQGMKSAGFEAEEQLCLFQLDLAP